MDSLPAATAAACPAPGPSPRLGFIGLGMMGRPMALRLLATSPPGAPPLRIADRSPEALAALAAAAPAGHPPETVADLAALAAGSDILLLMLPDSRAVEAVMEGLLPHLRPGMLLVDMGSSVPAETRRWAAAAAGRGAALVDAPVSGSVPKARDGTLAIMLGGAEAECARARPVLARLGATIIRTGPVGSAHAMKALNNFVYAAGLLAACEAVHMAEELGLDPEIFTEVLNASSGRNVATETKLRQAILNRRYDAGFQLGLMRKDLETAGSIAEETGFPAAALATCRLRWSAALDALGPQVDNTAIHRFLASEASP
ncbi:NAD(P)-dependent oxidoreductase [Roseomonas sp. 18066]|uniref:NAD(P)-dependent oxidoreductase n=1 Tax=Roseomonas sp. 18066 TaxID=2681412 RepID=UPI001359A71D|nr:NAD(P)-dependent oxidoreductase [Roseomonas sp. 18066]